MFEPLKILTAAQRDQAGGPAKRRVNVTEPRDVQALATELGCTQAELKAAVNEVGNIVSDVAGYLRGKLELSLQDAKRRRPPP